MNLPELQIAFQRYVLSELPGISGHVAPGPRDNAERRLRIYYDAYRSRLVEALSTDYEALTAVLGAERFRQACMAYVEATPSIWRNVRWYGGGLADFLEQTSPWCADSALAEIARFEWTLTLAFDASNETCLTFESLSALPPLAWETLQLRFAASAHLLRLHSNATAVRRAVDASEQVPEIVVNEEPVDWLVWRKDSSVHFRSLPGIESIAMRAAMTDASFPQVCEALCEVVPEATVASHAAAVLRSWVDDQLIVGVKHAAIGETEGAA
ncbi:MAG TPA: DNA-binding domain-containing protein [Burkholderiales bacterium]|nr:DNA-binding domain-containing protein [Burkholderiales bacterium]